MKLRVIKKGDNKAVFNIAGIDVSMANALRRMVISEIPTMAIENVSFYDNSSVMDDEILSHRLGLTPIKTDPSGPDAIDLYLEVKGPKTVYSRDLKIKETKIKGKSKSKEETIAAYENIPIVKLIENQSIKLEATARLGIGREHMKWQAGTASYEIKDDDSFDFFIESYGQFEILDLVDSVFDLFESKIKELKSIIK